VSRAPDLAEPVVGFRAWRAIGERLLSPYMPVRWEGRVLHAECLPANRALLFGEGWLAEPHRAPHPACRCGIYAHHRPGAQSYYGEFDWLPGVVTAWGTIEAHADGFRAEHARIEAFGADRRWPERRLARARAIAVRLGVPLVDGRDLAAVADEFGAPVPVSLRPA
jgi:hypothetical protein